MARILIIDDRDDSRDWVRSILEASGADVIEARDAVAGLQRAVEDEPSVVLVAETLCGLTAAYVRDHLATEPATSTLKTILMLQEFDSHAAALVLAAA